MSCERKWRRCVEAMVRQEGLAVVSVSNYANGHLRLIVGKNGQSQALTTGRADGEPRQHLNVRSRIRKIARRLEANNDY